MQITMPYHCYTMGKVKVKVRVCVCVCVCLCVVCVCVRCPAHGPRKRWKDRVVSDPRVRGLTKEWFPIACESRADWRAMYAEPVENVPQPDPVVCADCNRSFSRPGDRARHKCVVERTKPIAEQRGACPCGNCGRWFRSKGGLAVHRCSAPPPQPPESRQVNVQDDCCAAQCAVCVPAAFALRKAAVVTSARGLARARLPSSVIHSVMHACVLSGSVFPTTSGVIRLHAPSSSLMPLRCPRDPCCNRFTHSHCASYYTFPLTLCCITPVLHVHLGLHFCPI